MRHILTILVVALALGACADRYRNADPQVVTRCQYEKAKVSGHDVYSTVIAKNDVFRLCMQQAGY